jgi:hypothetical protein
VFPTCWIGTGGVDTGEIAVRKMYAPTPVKAPIHPQADRSLPRSQSIALRAPAPPDPESDDEKESDDSRYSDRQLAVFEVTRQGPRLSLTPHRHRRSTLPTRRPRARARRELAPAPVARHSDWLIHDLPPVIWCRLGFIAMIPLPIGRAAYSVHEVPQSRRQLWQAAGVTHPAVGGTLAQLRGTVDRLGPPQCPLYQRAYAGQLTECARWPYCVAPS